MASLNSVIKDSKKPSTINITDKNTNTRSLFTNKNVSVNSFSEAWPSNSYLSNREGIYLSSDMILKTDYFPSGHLADLPIHITGAPNFRQLLHYPIFGVGQPTLYGIKTILNYMRPNRVQWINLREEPICYLNSRTFVLRELKHPYRNIEEFSGISSERVSSIENTLIEDILNEAKIHAGNILVHDERASQDVVACFEAVDSDVISVASDVFEKFKNKGYSVDYSRIPVTPESVFSYTDFDALVNVYNINAIDSNVPVFIFNCQMGRGRSTLGMIIIALLLLNDNHISLPVIETSIKDNNSVDPFKAGDYEVILKLVRFLPFGRQARNIVDALISLSILSNLLEDLYESYLDMETISEKKAKFYHDLKRYFLLICFSHFLIVNPKTTFSAYMKQNDELTRLSELIGEPIARDEPLHIELNYNRRGAVLAKSTILKFDVAPVSVENLLNYYKFQKIKNFSIFSCAQPNLAGIKSIIDKIYNVKNNCSTITWINLREEPIIFIDKEPAILRDARHPFKLMPEFKSVHLPKSKLVLLEERLKLDVLKELELSQNKILLHEENQPNNIKSYWHVCLPTEIHTVSGLYESISKDFDSKLVYHRVPMIVDSIPGASAFDSLFSILMQPNALDNVIFNCHKGGRRSAVGMVIAALITRHLNSLREKEHTHMVASTPKTPMPTLTSPGSLSYDSVEADVDFDDTDIIHTAQVIEEPFSSLALSNQSSIIVDGEKVVPTTKPPISQIIHSETSKPLIGDYKAIIGLIRILKHGKTVKEETDAIIEQCSTSFNIKSSIYEARLKWETAREKSSQIENLNDAMERLQSYAMLIVFNAYLHEYFSKSLKLAIPASTNNTESLSARGLGNFNLVPSISASSPNNMSLNVFSENIDESSVMFQASLSKPSSHFLDHQSSVQVNIHTFSDWMKIRPEINTYLEACRKDPEASLSLDTSLAFGLNSKIFDRRKGNVLLGHSIIKSDYFSGCQDTTLPIRLNGAPNCRFIPGLHLVGTSMPTFEGINDVLSLLPNYADEGVVKSVRWCCLREEPVVYVNGRPFVLRDLDKPLENLEYTGINTRRVEAMEVSLKSDILAEAKKFNGRILLHDEAVDGSLLEIWEDIDENDVKTSRELYQEALTSFAVKLLDSNNQIEPIRFIFSRVPITDEQTPSPRTFDWFVKNIESATCGRYLIFNCQMGRGRTTTALIISALIAIHRPDSGIKIDDLKNNNDGFDLRKGGAGHLTALESMQQIAAKDSMNNSELLSKNYKEGEWKLIQKLIRLLENGNVIKSEVDIVIDYCSQVQNLRESIWSMKMRADKAKNNIQKEINEKRTINYLVRYFYLIVFASYLSEQSKVNFVKTFVQWLQENPSIDYLLKSKSFE